MPVTTKHSDCSTHNDLDERENLVTESFSKYHVYLVGYIFSLSGSHALAEDVIQDLWIHVYKSFKEEHIQCLPILKRKAWQKYVDHYRKIRRLNELKSDVELDSCSGKELREPFDEAEENDMEQQFWSEFPGIDLTDMQKNIIWLHARYGYTYAEIEVKTGVSSSSVCEWIQKARTLFTEYLARY